MKSAAAMTIDSGDRSKIDIKEIFSYFDTDKDGFLQAADLGTALRSYGLCPSQADIQQITSKLGGSKIDLESLKKIANNYSQSNKNNTDEIREALRIFDKNGTGMIDMFEMKHAMISLGEKLKAEEVDELIREADVDSDGNARFEDIVRILSTAPK